MYAANNCKGSEAEFRRIFLGAADHYAKKHKIPKAEADGLRAWLESLIAKDLKYYLNGTHTSFCESFHSLCNKLCPKALIKSFEMYCMRKECAVIQWNLKKMADFNQTPLIDRPYRVWIAEESIKRMHDSSKTPLAPAAEAASEPIIDVSSDSDSDSNSESDDDE